MTNDDSILAHKVVDELVYGEWIISVSIGHGLQKRMKVRTVLFPTPVAPMTLNIKKKKNWERALRKKVDSDARYNNVILRPFFHQNIAPFYLFFPLSHLASSMTVAVDEWQFLMDAFIIVVGSFEVEL